MAPTIDQTLAVVWALAEAQHWVVSRRQLTELGCSSDQIRHWLAAGRLFRVHLGVYAVGRSGLTPQGWWKAAALAAGDGALLDHFSCLALLGLVDRDYGPTTLSIPASRTCRRAGFVVHRRCDSVMRDRAATDGVPHLSVVRTLLDVAPRLGPGRLEALVNRADKLSLIDPSRLRHEVGKRGGAPGAPALRRLLDRHAFALTDSELERLFLRMVRRAGLPIPMTRQRVNGYRVDFYWPELGLVVETDGLRYHRTPGQQAKDRVRDQAHTAAGLTTLRFTHDQIAHRPATSAATVLAVVQRLRGNE